MKIKHLLIIIITLFILIVIISAVLLLLNKSAEAPEDIREPAAQEQEQEVEKQESEQAVGEPQENIPEIETDFLNNKEKPVQADSETQTKQSAWNLSRFFVERYGSYSTGNYSSVESLKVFMTPQFRAKTLEWINKQKQQDQDNSQFYSIITKTRALNFSQYSESQAQILVQTQRQERAKDGYSKMRQQSAQIDLINQAGQWKVSGLEWL